MSMSKKDFIALADRIKAGGDLQGSQFEQIVVARLDELESDRESLQDAVNDAQEAMNEAMADESISDVTMQQDRLNEAQADLAGWDEAEEYEALKRLIDEAEGCED